MEEIKEIKNLMIKLEKDFSGLEEENKTLKETIKKLEDEKSDYEEEKLNLNKVGLYKNLSKQINDKNREIEILNQKLDFEKNKSRKTSNDEPKLDDKYELMEYLENNYLKDKETLKLYYTIDKKTPGKYAGKINKKGKIKLKSKKDK
jgi:chromosome segregation ATPase